MTTVSSTTYSSTSSTTDAATLSSDFDDFLVLLTTQLQYQDPLDPMDSSEFTNQLVQFSQVEQQIKTNDYLETLNTYAQASDTIKALGYVGLQIQNEGDTFAYSEGYNVTINYEIPEDATSGTIAILDSDGNTIYTESIDEDNLAEGTHSFSWDGTDSEGDAAESGTYTISVSAFNSSVESLDVTTIVPGYVTGITTDDDGNILLIVNDTTVDVDDVTKATL